MCSTATQTQFYNYLLLAKPHHEWDIFAVTRARCEAKDEC